MVQILHNYFQSIYNIKMLFYSYLFLLLLVFLFGVILLQNDDYNEESYVVQETYNEIDEKKEEVKIKVDLKGQVQKPGVYEINAESNMADLIDLAKGFSVNADIQNISLVAQLLDGMVVKIPSVNVSKVKTKTSAKKNNSSSTENKESIANNSLSNDTESVKEKDDTAIEEPKIKPEEQEELKEVIEEAKIININTATKEELITLNGIGKSKAQAIIDYRNTIGLFATIDDIKNVKGIGEAIFAKIKDYITV